MSVTSGWDLGSEADRETGWNRTVPLGVAGVTRRGPLHERAAGWLWVVRFQGAIGGFRPSRSCPERDPHFNSEEPSRRWDAGDFSILWQGRCPDDPGVGCAAKNRTCEAVGLVDRPAERSRCNVSRTGQVTETLASRALAPRHKGQVIDAPEPRDRSAERSRCNAPRTGRGR
jgi:hypothetical protein